MMKMGRDNFNISMFSQTMLLSVLLALEFDQTGGLTIG
jgi:hypothetical protein